MRTLEWDDHTKKLILIDQRALPGQLTYVSLSSYQDVIHAIKSMMVRGAPAIGVTATFGMVLAALQSDACEAEELKKDLALAGKQLKNARPTAVNLAWAVDRMFRTIDRSDASIDDLRQMLLNQAQTIAEEDVAINKKMAEIGSVLIEDGDTIIHHCNTGSLAAVDWGTALGVIRFAHEQGKRIQVLVDETRPRLQGARLTAWECSQYGIPYQIITDNAAGHFLRTGQANKVFFGADRVAANGDVANKIGSYMLALAANANHVPVYSVFPTSTVDLNLANGDLIPIEERDPKEVLDIQIEHENIVPANAQARNPAFDVTPNQLFTALITEKGIIEPPFIQNLGKVIRE